jgi:hypothetical protein
MTAARQALGGFGMDHAGPRLDPFGLRGQIGGQGFDVGGIRQRVAGTLQRGLSGIHFGPELDQDEHGTYRWASGSGRGGRFASADEIDLFKKSQKIQGVIGAVGEKGLMGGIASEFPMLGGVLGGGAAVGGAIWAGSEIYGAQRQANMQFQRELGGSNLEAMRQRGNQQMFSLQQRFGVMGAGQANELYAGVVGIEEETRNGGFNRGAALNFGQHNASRFGMTAQQSIELINTASANGETSLSGLADALDRVTKSAREAGVNAEEARAKFTSYYQAAIQGGSGANAAAQAGNLASMQASLGPGFQSASFAGLVNGNPVNQIQQARSMGMGLVQYEQAVRDPRTGAATQASGETGQLAQITRGLLGQSGMSRVAAVTQSLGIGKGLKKESASDLTAADWLALENATGLEASTAQRALQSLMPGVQVSGDQALKAIAGVQAGIISPQAEQAARAQKSAVHEADAHDVARAQWGQNNPLKDRIGGTSGTPFSQETKVRHQNRQAYIKRVASSKMESPIVEALLKDQDFHRRFQVESDDGLRVVDLKTAMESYYDQIASGAAQIVAGTGSGGTIADYVANVGLAADPNASTELGGMNTAKTTGAGKDKKGNERIAPGQSAADWQKEQDKKGGSTTHVLIEATPELRRLFRITPGSAAAAVKSAGISGTTPPSSTDPGSRWGGWPVGP